MNDVIGQAEISLDKKQPKCTLGNFMVDALYVMGAEKYNTKVDAAFINYGGIRLTQLPAGNITNGKIFELMPFDNLLILPKTEGISITAVAGYYCCEKRWPVAGITMQIKIRKP